MNYILLNKLRTQVKEMIKDRESGHDFEHIMRVYQNAKLIGKKEGADLNVLLAACLLHDLIVYPKGTKDSVRSANDSATLAKQILKKYSWCDEIIKRVCYCIEVHSYSKNIIPTSLEGKILQDADRLDALGAIGIARTFTIGGSESREVYNSEDPFHKSTRKLDDTRWILDHFGKKLLKLQDTMHTETAIKIAFQRTSFMQLFLAQLETELNQEDFI